MNLLIVLLRLVHIVLGVLWVGMIAFMVVFLTPALRDAGPDGAKVMMALQRAGWDQPRPIRNERRARWRSSDCARAAPP